MVILCTMYVMISLLNHITFMKKLCYRLGSDQTGPDWASPWARSVRPRPCRQPGQSRTVGLLTSPPRLYILDLPGSPGPGWAGVDTQ